LYYANGDGTTWRVAVVVAAAAATSGQSNLTCGRITAAHRWFSHIRQFVPMCTPYIESHKVVAMAMSLVAGYRQYLHFVGRPCNNQYPSRYHSHKGSYSNFSPKIG